MRIRRSDPFKRDFAKLPKEIQHKVKKTLRLLAQNPYHPSLRTRIVDRKRRIWKANVDGGYRLTFQIEGEKKMLILRRIGPHDLMERSERW